MRLDEIAVRRILVAMHEGSKATIQQPGVPNLTVADYAKAFAKARKIGLEINVTNAGVEVTRVKWETRRRGAEFSNMDSLKVGESFLFNLAPTMHQSVRVAASVRSRSGEVRYACNREGNAIRVTRLPLTAEEMAAYVPNQTPAQANSRQTVWGLERLATQTSLTFDISPQDRLRLRCAVSQKGARTGWRLRCRVQDDGTMLVQRLDAATPPASHHT